MHRYTHTVVNVEEEHRTGVSAVDGRHSLQFVKSDSFNECLSTDDITNVFCERWFLTLTDRRATSGAML
jgi:hypothetical protein